MSHGDAPHDGRALGLAGLGAVVLAALAVHGWIAAWDLWTSTFSDSIDYLFMADFYRTLLYGGDVEAARAHYGGTRFPPLFPFLLGLAGAGSSQPHAAALVSNAIAVLACIAVWGWLRVERGDARLATVVALALVLFPWHFILNLTPVSEPLGILLCALAFLLLAREPVGRSKLLAAACVIGLAPLARSALLPLCIAFPLWLAFRPATRWREAWLPAAVAWLPFAGWTTYRSLIGAHSYAAQLTPAQFAAAGMTWPEALWQQPRRLLDAFVAGWAGPDGSPWMFAGSLLLALLAAAGTLLRLRRNRLDAWFLAGYVALVLLWPFPAEHTRFVVAVFPFALVAAWSALDAGWERVHGAPAPAPATALLAALVAALAAPGFVRFAHRAGLEVPDELLGEKREPWFFLQPTDREALAAAEIGARARLLLQEASVLMPPDACLYATRPQLARLFAQRRALDYPDGLGADTAEADRRLATCDYFFVGAWKSRAYGTPAGYPEASLQGWTEPVLVSRMAYGKRDIVAASLSRRLAPARGGTTDPLFSSPPARP